MARPRDVRGGRPCHETAPRMISDPHGHAANGSAPARQWGYSATWAGQR